ncbi:MAG: hypothetical protein ACLGH5_03190 [Actinomycetes bacterium]
MLAATLRNTAIGIALMGLLTLSQLPGTSSVSYRDRFDVFLDLTNSPLTLLFALFVPILAGAPTLVRLRERHLMLLHYRGRLGRALAGFFASSAVIAGATGAAFALWPALVAFVVWPQRGDPNLFPEDYGLTTATALADAAQRSSYSQLLMYGEGVFVAAYVGWVALAAVALAWLAVAMMLLTPSLGLAVVAPWVLFLAWSIGAQILGQPVAALSFSIFPSGLAQSEVFAAAAPGFVLLALAVIAVAVAVLRRRAIPWAL